MRESDAAILTHAGPEIGVASTKAFVAMLTAGYLLAVRMGRARGALSLEEGRRCLDQLWQVRPNLERLLTRDAVAREARLDRVPGRRRWPDSPGTPSP